MRLLISAREDLADHGITHLNLFVGCDVELLFQPAQKAPFNARFRQERLNAHCFLSLQHAREKVEAWRQDYNHDRPHSSLGQVPLIADNSGRYLVSLKHRDHVVQIYVGYYSRLRPHQGKGSQPLCLSNEPNLTLATKSPPRQEQVGPIRKLALLSGLLSHYELIQQGNGRGPRMRT